jgi:hypothetical protein
VTKPELNTWIGNRAEAGAQGLPEQQV